MNPRALRRYSRHLLIPEVGLAGQERLAASRVLVVGAGRPRFARAAVSRAAGVGRIGIVDDDEVDETNLQRQTIFGEADVGQKQSGRRGGAAAGAQSARRTSIRFRCASTRETRASSCGCTTWCSIAPTTSPRVS